ncbi:MAG: type II toxin-antitoxin system VapC family toxin [Opitutaceae bacterium]
MTSLDTSCFVKLCYPEPDSPKAVALVQGKSLCYTLLHDLEFTNALQLKAFIVGATAAQVKAARGLVAADLKSGTLVSCEVHWEDVLAEAVKLADQLTATLGARSLDILHCAVARKLGVREFITTDSRQKKLAVAIGLNVVSL